MRIAIIGYGGVGRALVKLIKDKKDELLKDGINPVIKYVIASKGGVYDSEGIDLEKFVDFSFNNKDITRYPEGGSNDIFFRNIIENKDVDFVIEMTPTNIETGEPALTYIKTGLENKINVVTSNKGPILLKYKELNKLATSNNVDLGIGCTTGGALPTIDGGKVNMAGAEIKSIEGILNGTTNFILEDMEVNHSTYLQSLKKAQELGIAETDPTLDVEGWDTASKLLILTNVLMNQDKKLEDIKVTGITHITPEQIAEAKLEGKKYKLIGKALNRNGTISMEVKLDILNVHSSMYNVNGKNKAVK